MAVSDVGIVLILSIVVNGLPGGSDDKESACEGRKPGFDPWIGKIPWRRECLSTPVLWPGEFHGQRSLAGYSLWGHKESDMTKQLRATTERERENTSLIYRKNR